MSASDSESPFVPYHLASLNPREAIADAVCRLLAGIDSYMPHPGSEPSADALALIRSSFSPTGQLMLPELSPGNTRPPVVGIDAFLQSIDEGVGGALDTEHTIGNMRIWIDESAKKAKMDAKGVAYHFRLGEGGHPGKAGFNVGTRYLVDLERKESGEGQGQWLIERLDLRIMWTEGDMGVLEVMGKKSKEGRE